MALGVLLGAANSSRYEFDRVREMHEARFHEQAKLSGRIGSQSLEFVRG
jgi:hypothetical protein